MNIEKDYYQTLGVAKSATAEEIKRAFRALAVQFHPDRNPGDTAAEERFKEISEANDVLGDPDQRRQYDEQRSLLGAGFRVPRGAQGGPGGPSGASFEDLLRNARGGLGGLGDIFGDLFHRGGRGSTATGGPRRGQDVEGEVTIDFAEAFRGVVVGLTLTAPQDCGTCAGLGSAPGTLPRTCPTCNGLGLVSRNQGAFGFSEPCRDCHGTGRIIDSPCPDCGGAGHVTGSRTINVKVPAGIGSGKKVKVRGKGGAGQRGGPAGDLYVTVHVRPHQLFGRRGDDLTLRLPVSFPEAAIGATVTVPTMDDPVTVRIPPGTASGRTLRVRGRGVTKASGVQGDLLVTVEVVVPGALTEQEREALQAYADLHTADPRPDISAAIATTAAGAATAAGPRGGAR